MHSLVVLVLVGLLAQLVDGALGMGYGATSTTLLLSAGFAPAAASASIHLAEVGTTLLSAVAHTSFGNVSWPTVRRLALPGALGAFLGAVLLSRLSTEAARPWMAGLLGGIGVFVLIRFALRPVTTSEEHATPPGRRSGTTLGLFAGFLDATGGGGWGPIATPTLLLSGRLPARLVVGSVDTCEFLVAFAASTGFLLSLGSEVVSLPVIIALLAGGLVAAPLAAWLVHKIPPRLLGAAVGGLLTLTNARLLLAELAVPAGTRNLIYTTLLTASAAALLHARRTSARQRQSVNRAR